jgi:hypothetical protein
MPHLDWRKARAKAVLQADPRGSRLALSAARAELEALIAELVLVYREGTELRVELSGGFMLYFKRRDDGSRALLAHPSSEEWVITLALATDAGASAVTRLRGLSQGARFAFSELVELGFPSNVDLEIAYEEGEGS